jgi:hypothetical protein
MERKHRPDEIEAILAAASTAETVADFCVRYGISQSTLYQWRNAARERAEAAVLSETGRPLRASHISPGVRSVGVVPLLPRGATMGSFADALHLLNGYQSFTGSYRLLFGSPNNPFRNLLGNGAAVCASVIRQGDFSDVDRILEAHTLWPLLAYSLPEMHRESWRRIRHSQSEHEQRKFMGKWRLRHFVSDLRRACPSCMRQEQEIFGSAFWHVEHQLRFIDHCPTHLEALVWHCHACGTLIFPKSASVLPSPECRHCGTSIKSGTKANPPAAYWSFIELLKLAFNGQWDILSPTLRRPYYREFASAWTGGKEVKQLLEDIVTSWNETSTEALAARFSASLDLQTVAAALRGDDSRLDVMTHVLLLSHISGLHGGPRHILDTGCCPPFQSVGHAIAETDSEERPFRLPPCKRAELQNQLAMASFPIEIADDLERGISRSASCFKRRCSLGRWNTLFVALPWFHGYAGMIAEAFRSGNSMGSRVIDLRRKYRNLLCGWLTTEPMLTRTQFTRRHPGASKWLRHNDADWFQNELPSRRAVVFRKTHARSREEYKAAILAAIASVNNPTRSQIWHVDKHAMLWASRHDHDWLQAVLPTSVRNGAR